MKNSFLIQILEAPKDRHAFSFGGGSSTGGLTQENFDGMAEVFSFHYMGAAEFEFDELPRACNKVMAERADYITGSMEVRWETEDWETEDWKTREKKEGLGEVYYICHKDHEIDVKGRISLWALGKTVPMQSTKECVRLDEAFANDAFKGWFEYDNGFLFFIDKEMFEGTKVMFGIGEDKQND